LNGIHISRPIECQLKMMNVQGDQVPAKQPQILKENIRELIHEDCRWTIHELADTTGISYGVCQEILRENLHMRCIDSKFVPWLLTNDWKHWCVNVFELWENVNQDPTFISRIIMGDESWIYSYDPETKQQSSQWKNPQSPRANKVWQVQSLTKSMVIGSVWTGLITMTLFLLTLWSTLTFTLTFWDTWEKMCDKKTGTLVQPQLAPSSWQRACLHVRENHRVCD
jgi:histone-lysine N-methyltransferase SETMAR